MEDLRIRTIQAVPEGIPIAKLLQILQAKHTKIAVVIDEHGGTSGIVTMSDIMEQIVGRIDDEYVHDTDDDIEELPDGTYQINGTLAIDDLVELLGFEPEEANDVETAGRPSAVAVRPHSQGGRRGGAGRSRHEGDVHRARHGSPPHRPHLHGHRPSRRGITAAPRASYPGGLRAALRPSDGLMYNVPI